MNFVTKKSRKNASWALIFSIIFMHFMIVSIFNFPLTFTPFFIMYFLIVHFKIVFKRTPLVISALLLFWPFLVLAIYEIAGGHAEIDRFFRTFSLWICAVVFMLVCTSSVIKKNINFSREFFIALVLIILYSMAQIITARVFNSTALYFPFGDHSYFGVSDPSNLVGDGFSRAPGFYLEPSFCAFVILFLLTAVLIREIKPIRVACLIVGGFFAMLIVGSATGILAVVGLGCFIFWSFFRWRLVLVASLLSLGIIFFAGDATFSERFSELSVEGSSGYWRLVAPLIVISKVFADFPFGVPLGQVDNFVTPLGLQHGQSIGSSIDNGIFYLIFSFGWLALIFFGWLIFKFVRSLYYGDHADVAYWWFLIVSLQFSGGILLPEYIYPLLLLTYTYRIKRYALPF